MPSSHFHPLFCCNSLPFSLSHYSLPSKLFICFLIALKYTPFNLSLLAFIHISFVSSSLAADTHFQAASFLLTVAFISSFYHTLFPPTLTEPHTSLALSTIAHFTCSHICSTFSLNRPSISFSVLMFPQFLACNPPSTNHHLPPLNSCPYQPDFTEYKQHSGLKGHVPSLSPPSHPAHITAYPSSPAPDLSCF